MSKHLQASRAIKIFQTRAKVHKKQLKRIHKDSGLEYVVSFDHMLANDTHLSNLYEEVERDARYLFNRWKNGCG